MKGSRPRDPGATPLRIALFHDLPSGGAKRTAYAQVAGLVERGHRVSCFTTSNGEENFFPLRQVAHEVTVLQAPDPPDRERTLTGRPTPLDLLRWANLFRGIRGVGRRVALAAGREDFDVLLVHPSQFTQAPHVLRWSRIPTVYYCHEVLRAAYEPLISGPISRLGIRWTLGRVDRRNARKATILAVNSEYTRQRVREVYGRDATVVSPGVDLQRFRPSGSPRGTHVLAVGALHPLKGLDFILEAISRLSPSLRPPLVVVSDRAREGERARLMRRARGLEIHLDLRERVSEEELAELYSGARALAFAAHNEPLGLVPLEAMACGTPVVAVSEGGVSETVVDGITGHLVPRDPRNFAGALRQMLENPDEIEEMGRRGRKHVEENWSWERSVELLEELVRSTAASA